MIGAPGTEKTGGVILPVTSEFRSKMILSEESQKIQVGIANF